MSNRIIRDRAIVEDRWLLVEAGEALPSIGDIIVPLALWLEQREQLIARSGLGGVWLAPGDEPGLLATDTATLPLIAVRFPQFADGRGYSTARLLRERYGFNAFTIKAGKSIEDALKAFDDFSDAYQSSVAQALPLYQRRLQRQDAPSPATAAAP